MTSSRSIYVWILTLAIAAQSQVQAGSVTNTDDYVINYLGAQGPNAVGVPTGLFLYVGGAFDPVAGTTVTATQGAITGDIPFNGSSRADLFARGVQILPTTDLSQLTGSWTLTASNPALSSITVSTNAILPSVVSYFQAALGPGGGSLFTTPFGMSVSDLSTNPSISWFVHTPLAGGISPSGTTYSPWSYIRAVSSPNILVNGDGTYFIYSCDEYGILFSGCSVVFHPFYSGSAPLALGQSYIIDTSSTFLLDPLLSSVQGTADSFFAFTPSKLQLTAGVPIFLPQETTEGSFLFDMPVIANNPVYLDPTVATGYDFQTGLGDPLFSSVEFPDLGVPNYSISLWDGSKYVFDALVAPNTQFFFPGGGVDRFRVGGIDPGLGLDPQDGTAFPAEVTFASNGSFTGTMTPLTENVPEPATLALLGLGLAGLGFSRRKQ